MQELVQSINNILRSCLNIDVSSALGNHEYIPSDSSKQYISGHTSSVDIASILFFQESENLAYEVDIKYSFNNSIFRQNLVDFGWVSKFTKLNENPRIVKNKVVLYFCSQGSLDDDILISNGYLFKHSSIHDDCIVGKYWNNVLHLYVERSSNNPFVLEESHPPAFSPLSDIPKVTIVTVVFNGVDHIEQTIQSVINQTYQNLEYIVIDGCSTDGTVSILEKYSPYIDILVSEVDSGIYDAMNKGLRIATGDYVNFMNSGDLFYDFDVLYSLNLQFSDSSFCGASVFLSDYSHKALVYRMNGMNIPHQGLFMNKVVANDYRFDETYKYSGDGELWTRLVPHHSIEELHRFVSLSRFGGVSTNSKYLIPRMKEQLKYEKSKLGVIKKFSWKVLISPFFSESFLERMYFMKRGVKLSHLDPFSDFP
jgi:glycosyltransferase involved in cell wall biosynthesis